MKLNYDCMRSILLVLEKELTLNDDYSYSDLFLNDFLESPDLKKFDKNDISYNLYKLSEANYIVAGQLHLSARNTAYWIRTITYEGHEFLENVRKDETWGKVKNIANKVGANSLSVIAQISSNVITQLIKVQMGLS